MAPCIIIGFLLEALSEALAEEFDLFGAAQPDNDKAINAVKVIDNIVFFICNISFNIVVVYASTNLIIRIILELL